MSCMQIYTDGTQSGLAFYALYIVYITSFELRILNYLVEYQGGWLQFKPKCCTRTLPWPITSVHMMFLCGSGDNSVADRMHSNCVGEPIWIAGWNDMMFLLETVLLGWKDELYFTFVPFCLCWIRFNFLLVGLEMFQSVFLFSDQGFKGSLGQ